MKLGVISDLHGNIEALNTVFEDFKKRNIEKILCCGDIIGIGPRPEETVQKVMEYKDKFIAVRGNHEQYLIDGIPARLHGRDIREDEIGLHKWTHSKVSNKSKDFLESLPLERTINICNKKIYISHYAYDKNKIHKKHILEPTLEEADELFSEIDADIILFGHTHKKIFNKGSNRWYINPGALGCPENTNKAYYGILDIEDEKTDYKQFSIEYDAESVRKEIENFKFPFYKQILQIFYGDASVF